MGEALEFWSCEHGGNEITFRTIRFGVFQVNVAAWELRKHGVRVRLPGQPFCILSMLLEKPGEVVTREEMRERLWPSDTFVDFERSLNTAIKKLRAALADSSENSRYIETVPRVGYRFIAPIGAPESESDATSKAEGDKSLKATAKPLTKTKFGVWVLVGAGFLVLAGSAALS